MLYETTLMTYCAGNRVGSNATIVACVSVTSAVDGYEYYIRHEC